MSKMTLAEKSAQLQRLAHKQGWRCARCGRSLGAGAQRAHKIPQSKWAYRRYSAAIIDHDLNMDAVCGLACNSATSLGVSGTIAEMQLVQKIRRALCVTTPS